MLPKLSAALNQIIGPVASPSKLDEKLGDQADASRTKPFEKFDPKKHGSRHKKGSSQGSGEHSGEPSQEGAPQLRVIPGGLGPGGNNLIPRESALQGKANGSSSVSFLELLSSLKQKKELFVKIGISVYQKLRQTQGHGKIRKGSIVDEKV